MKVAIIGASAKPGRYANKAQRMLVEHGHSVFPISPHGHDILGAKGYSSILDLPEDQGTVHTATIYVGPAILDSLVAELLEFRPARIILNPGTESESASRRLSGVGCLVVEACTMVMLATGQFETGVGE